MIFSGGPTFSCGDRSCNGDETCDSCPEDCSGTFADCNLGLDELCFVMSSSWGPEPNDCHVTQCGGSLTGVCFDTACRGGYTELTPQIECGAGQVCCEIGTSLTRVPSCGDGVCDPSETCWNCIWDCVGVQSPDCRVGELCSMYDSSGFVADVCRPTCQPNAVCIEMGCPPGYGSLGTAGCGPWETCCQFP